MARQIKKNLLFGFLLLLLVVLANGVISYRATLRLVLNNSGVEHTVEVREALTTFLQDLIDAESNQRGYVITGRQDYLAPYGVEIGRAHRDLEELLRLTGDDSEQQNRVFFLRQMVLQLEESLQRGLRFRREGDISAAQTEVFLGEGTRKMEEIRVLVARMEAVENSLMTVRKSQSRASRRESLATFTVASAVSLMLLTILFIFMKNESEIHTRKEEELEAKVRQRTAALEGANKELEAFSYSVSHDLRAPLQSIAGFSQALIEDQAERLNEEGRSFLLRIRAATERMGHLIDDLLRLSRVMRTELSPRRVDFTALAKETVEIMQTHSEHKAQVEVESGMYVTADSRLLQIVIENLIGNAFKFTGKTKSPHITIGFRIEESTPVYFVKDNGAGFDMAYAHELFTAFHRLHGDKEFSGTGIGLATADRIIKRHGGKIWAEGKVGQGATFFFTLESSFGIRLGGVS